MTGKRTTKSTGASFEDDLRRLEEIVDRLEQGDVPLEDSLRLYEEGIILSKQCMKRLNQAEKKLEILRNQVGDELWDGESPVDHE